MAESATPVRLDYATARPSRRRRIAWLAILSILGVNVYWQRGRLGDWYVDAQFAAAQRRCLEASLPMNTLVAQATRAKQANDDLLRDPAFFAAKSDPKPPLFVAYRRWGGEASLRNLGAGAIEGPLSEEGLLFLHELRKPDGQRRLVRVGIWCLSSSERPGRFYISMRTAVYTVASFGQRPTQLGAWTLAFGDDDPFGPANELQFFAAVVDDSDPGVFRIPLKVDGQPQSILGKLTHDDQIRMRHAPSMP